MTALTQIQEAVAGVLRDAVPAVVAVGRGTGIVTADGTVVTNAHNLVDQDVEVAFADGRRAVATVAGVDIDGDLAVLQVDTGDSAAIPWASDTIEPGTAVLAVGTPRRGTPSVTVGFVSGVDRTFRGPRGRRITEAFEHSAPLPRGSSGGPVLDVEGRLIGINTHRRSDGFYLAQPATAALRERLEALGRGEVPRRPRLGIAIAPAHVARRLRAAVGLDERDGVLVRDADPDGAGAQAGLRRGDLIVAAGGRDVRRPSDLEAALEQAGDTLALEVVRGTEQQTLTVTFAAD